MMRLIFIGQDCVKKIGGDAILDVAGAAIVEEPPYAAGVPMALVKLIGGVVTVVAPAPPTPAEIAAAEAKANQDEVLRKIFRVAFTHENRILVLEGKAAITAAQFRTAVTAL